MVGGMEIGNGDERYGNGRYGIGEWEVWFRVIQGVEG